MNPRVSRSHEQALGGGEVEHAEDGLDFDEKRGRCILLISVETQRVAVAGGAMRLIGHVQARQYQGWEEWVSLSLGQLQERQLVVYTATWLTISGTIHFLDHPHCREQTRKTGPHAACWRYESVKIRSVAEYLRLQAPRHQPTTLLLPGGISDPSSLLVQHRGPIDLCHDGLRVQRIWTDPEDPRIADDGMPKTRTVRRSQTTKNPRRKSRRR